MARVKRTETKLDIFGNLMIQSKLQWGGHLKPSKFNHKSNFSVTVVPGYNDLSHKRKTDSNKYQKVNITSNIQISEL